MSDLTREELEVIADRIATKVATKVAEDVAEEAAARATERTLKMLGLDAANPLDSQADMAYVRKQRLASEKISAGVRWAIISAFLSGAAATLWVGLKAALTNG